MTRRGKNDWRISMLLFGFASFAESLAFGHFSAFTPMYLELLGVHGQAVATWTGILGSLGFVLGLPLLPFWGAFAERFGRKPVIIRSSVVEAVIFLLAATAHSPFELAVARALSGFVMGNTGVMMAVQSEITPEGRLGLAVAAIGSGPSLASALGPMLGGWLVVRIGLRALFFLDSAATSAAALLMALLLREERARQDKPVGRLALSALLDIGRLPGVRQLFLLLFFVTFGATATQPFLPLFVRSLLRLGRSPFGLRLPEAIGLVFTLGGVGMALSTPLWGPAIDRFGRRLCLRLSALGVALGLLGQGFAGSVAGLAAARLLQGLAQGGVLPAFTATLAQETPPSRRSSILNLSILPQQIGWFFGPLTATGAVAALGLREMLIAFGVLTAAGAGLAFLLPLGAPGEAVKTEIPLS